MWTLPHMRFSEFDQWVYDFNKLDCLAKKLLEHDPNTILQFHSWATNWLERKDIFKNNKGDPQKAIAMAIPRN